MRDLRIGDVITVGLLSSWGLGAIVAVDEDGEMAWIHWAGRGIHKSWTWGVTVHGSLLPTCEYCAAHGAQKIRAMTAYHWDGKSEDPNRDLTLCVDCADEYLEYWQERWDDYYSDIRAGLSLCDIGWRS